MTSLESGGTGRNGQSEKKGHIANSLKLSRHYSIIETSKTHQLHQSLWESEPSTQNFLSFEPTCAF